MLARQALVAPLVVASYSGHTLLRFCDACAFDFSEEAMSVISTQHRGSATVMKQLDFARLELAEGEAEVFLFFAHGTRLLTFDASARWLR